MHLLGVRGAVAHEGVERGTEDKFHISVLPDPSDTLTLQMWKVSPWDVRVASLLGRRTRTRANSESEMYNLPALKTSYLLGRH